MRAIDKLREALQEMKQQRDKLDRDIAKIQEVLGEAPERAKRGRPRKAKEPKQAEIPAA